MGAVDERGGGEVGGGVPRCQFPEAWKLGTWDWKRTRTARGDTRPTGAGALGWGKPSFEPGTSGDW
jgi:hypothetical protein